MLSAYTRCKENMPGSQPQEINVAVLASLATLSTLAKCSGIRACVSKESMQLKYFVTIGVCSIRSVAEPPQRTITSILPLKFGRSSIVYVGTPETVSKPLRRENTPTSSISGCNFMDASTPRPKLP